MRVSVQLDLNDTDICKESREKSICERNNQDFVQLKDWWSKSSHLRCELIQLFGRKSAQSHALDEDLAFDIRKGIIERQLLTSNNVAHNTATILVEVKTS